MNKILINIDSRQRNVEYYPNSNYFKLGNESESDLNFYNYLNFKNIDYISLASIEIPNNFYIFTDARFNNFFYVNCNIVNFDNYIEYDIPEYFLTPGYQSEILYGGSYIFISSGNYDPDTLANEININLNQLQFNIGYFEEGNSTFNVIDGLFTKYNPNTLKLNFYNKSNTYSFDIEFNNYNNQYVSFGYMLGYRLNKYTLSILEDMTNDYYLNIPQYIITLPQLLSEAMVDIDGERYIFIKINDYGNLYLNHKTPIKALGKIILNNSKENYIFINSNEYMHKSHKFIAPVNINKLEIELLDYNGNRLDNSNCDYSFTLELGQIYDENVLNNIIKKTNNIDNENIKNNIINNDNNIINNDNNLIYQNDDYNINLISNNDNIKNNNNMKNNDNMKNNIINNDDYNINLISNNNKKIKNKNKKKNFGFEY